MIRKAIEDCGYHCRGEMVPKHLCGSATLSAATTTAAHAQHIHDHAAAPPAASAHVHASHSAHAMPAHAGMEAARPPRHDRDKAAASATVGQHPGHGEHAMPDMMHDMGHAPGVSMQDMVRDMRNRFFAIPVVLYSPMGKMLGDFPTPFGLDRKLFLFIVGKQRSFIPRGRFSWQRGAPPRTACSTWRR